MGRIKTAEVRRLADALISEHGQEFTTSFEENKALVGKFLKPGYSKKIRNITAGLITRLKVREQKEV